MATYRDLKITKISDKVTSNATNIMNFSSSGMVTTAYTNHGVYNITWKGMVKTVECKNGDYYIENVPLKTILERK